MHRDEKQPWETYKKRELAGLSPILLRLGYVLEEKQPHLGGERHLTRPLSGGRKLVLLGNRTNDKRRVVIKTSSEKAGIAEIEHEHMCRRMLEDISFAYQTFLSPEELLFVREGVYAILITEFIEQEQTFLERPLKEQFTLALTAFKAQEGAHATTYDHANTIRNTFGEMTASGYYTKIQQYTQDIAKLLLDRKELYSPLDKTLDDAVVFLRDQQTTLAQYGGFLTHWDFTPQNFRIANHNIYLLDHSSLRFGNKYEGWARFINFMTLHNPPLEQALVEYVRLNRTAEEFLALKLMRAYRLVELIRYYATWLSGTEGDLHELARTRVLFWSEVLQRVLTNTNVPLAIIETYKNKRDVLRSPDEKERQKGLH